MTTKAFSILLLTTLVLGVALGGAFAGGFALGRSGEAVQPPESRSLRPPTAGQAAGRSRGGQAQVESGDVAVRTGVVPEQGDAADASAGSPAGRQGADGSAVTADGSANRGQDAGGVQELFGAISSLQGDLVTVGSPRGPGQATISETTVIQKRVMSSVEDLSGRRHCSSLGTAWGRRPDPSQVADAGARGRWSRIRIDDARRRRPRGPRRRSFFAWAY